MKKITAVPSRQNHNVQMSFNIGVFVTINGLKSQTSLNGKKGIIISYMSEKERFEVGLASKKIQVKSENLNSCPLDFSKVTFNNFKKISQLVNVLVKEYAQIFQEFSGVLSFYQEMDFCQKMEKMHKDLMGIIERNEFKLIPKKTVVDIMMSSLPIQLDTDTHRLNYRIESVLRALLQYDELIEHIQTIPKAGFLKNIGRANLWRLLIDGQRQKTKGPSDMFDFDVKEINWMGGMIAGLRLMIDNLGKPLTSDMILQFQYATCNGVVEYKNGEYSELELGFRDRNDDKHYKVAKDHQDSVRGNLTDDGGTQLGNHPAYSDWFQLEKITSPKEASFYWFRLLPKSTEEIVDKLNSFIEKLNQDLKDSDKKDNIHVFCDFIQSANQHHGLRQGNIRTLVMLILNKLLIEKELLPTAMRNPNNFDVFSLKEVKEEVKLGQKTVESYSK